MTQQHRLWSDDATRYADERTAQDHIRRIVWCVMEPRYFVRTAAEPAPSGATLVYDTDRPGADLEDAGPES